MLLQSVHLETLRAVALSAFTSRSELFQVFVAPGRSVCALPAPSTSLYLGKSCSTCRPLSQGDGRDTRWGRSHAGSPGGHPDKYTGCRAGGQRSGRLGATPPHVSTSSHHAHRLDEDRKGERSVLQAQPDSLGSGRWDEPWRSSPPQQCAGQGVAPVP